jgi:hypothetical protein
MGSTAFKALLVGAVMAQAGGAFAQAAEDTAAARVLFDEARRLAADGDFAAACPKFEESQRLEPGVGTQFNLADCWERTGRTASAWALFLEVANKTRLAGQTEREKVARDRAEALKGRLSTLTVTVPSPVPGLEIRRGDVAVGAAQIGVATPVDPGAHVIHATAPGFEPWTGRIEVAGEGAAETIEVPALHRAASEAPPAEPAPPAVPTASTSSLSTQPAEPDDAYQSRVLGYSLLGVGTVGLGVATFFGLRVRSRDGELADICPASVGCTEAEVQRYETVRNEAVAARTASYVSFGVGMAVLSAGAVITLQRGAHRGTALRVDGRGVQLEGEW